MIKIIPLARWFIAALALSTVPAIAQEATQGFELKLGATEPLAHGLAESDRDFNERAALGGLAGPTLAEPSAATGGAAGQPHEEEVNNGQDPSRPVRRFDVRYQYQDLAGATETQLLTLRMDWPFVLSDEWKLNTRIDLPLLYSDVPSFDNPTGDNEFGAGDVLIQGLLIHPLSKELVVAFGAQLILPTASDDQFGSGRFRILPTVALIARPNWLPQGWFFGAMLRYDADFAGDDDRDFRQSINIEPILNIQLPHHWFITIAPEFKFAVEDGNDWFIPFDITVGTMLNKSTVISVEFKHEIVDDFTQFEWAVEFRIGFFF